MNVQFKFSHLIGSFYTGGDIIYSSEGWKLFSPVGNQVSTFDLKEYKSITLQVNARKTIERVVLAPGNALMLAIDEDGTAYLYSLVAKSILHRHRFSRRIRQAKFCKNIHGELLLGITFDSLIHIYKILSLNNNNNDSTTTNKNNGPPIVSLQFNPFELVRSYFGPTSETTCLDWSGDGRTFLAGAADMSVRLFAANKCPKLAVYVLAHHKDVIISTVFLSDNTLDCLSLSRDGQLCIWQCDTALNDLYIGTGAAEAADEAAAAANDSGKDADDTERQQQTTAAAPFQGNLISYQRTGRHYYRKNVVAESYVTITAVDYSRKNRLLACALSNGMLCIHELPDFVQIQMLQVSPTNSITLQINALRFNSAADWLAMASSQTGQLIVYDWQAQSYVVNQTGHYNQSTCAAYSPDGSVLVSGSDDGKVKVWDPSSGFCTITFTEHTAAVTAVQVVQSGRAVLSASRDGTVRAFDLVRYRNFRTFTAPRTAQFSCLAVDASGELVAAASDNAFEVYVWSVKTGRLLEELTGHEAPVAGVAFGQAVGRHLLLATCSWDNTCKVWDAFTTGKQSHETLRLDADGLAVAYRPDGAQFAVCTLKSTIMFFAVAEEFAEQCGTIDARNDLGRLRRNNEAVSGAVASRGRSFTTLCYSADGNCLLVGGQSKFICLYYVGGSNNNSQQQRMMIKRIAVTCNFSLDRMQEFLNRSQMTEFGSRARQTNSKNNNGDADDNDADSIRLPGVRGGAGQLTSREYAQPEARCHFLTMSPTGQSFAACTQDGVQIYSLNQMDVFNPFDLDVDIDPQAIYAVIDNNDAAAADDNSNVDYERALLMALKLNRPEVTAYVVERVPAARIAQVARSVPQYALTRLVEFVAQRLESTKHVEFYVQWVRQILYAHGMHMKLAAAAAGSRGNSRQSYRASINRLSQCLMEKKEQVGKTVLHALYTSRFVVEQETLAAELRRRKKNDAAAAAQSTMDTIVSRIDA